MENETPTSRLYDLVLDFKWKEVEEHVAQNPQDAKWLDLDSGETPLYLALQVGFPPLSSVRALVNAYPEAVLTPQTKNKNWPIHMACRFGKPEEKRNLLELLLGQCGSDKSCTAQQQATARTKYGKAPLAALCDSFPLQDYLDGFIEEFGTGETIARSRELLQNHWDCIRLLLGAASLNKVIVAFDESNPPFLPLHCALKLSQEHDCPLDVLRISIHMCPQKHMLTPDSDGRLPLHLALSNAMDGIGFKSPNDCNWTVSVLVSKCPEAAAIRDPVTQLYPLQMATKVQQSQCTTKPARSGVGRRLFEAKPPSWSVSCLPWESVLQPIFQAHPDALMVEDISTRFYPFMDAASSVAQDAAKGTVELEILTNVYQLLRIRPDAISCRLYQ